MLNLIWLVDIDQYIIMIEQEKKVLFNTIAIYIKYSLIRNFTLCLDNSARL